MQAAQRSQALQKKHVEIDRETRRSAMDLIHSAILEFKSHWYGQPVYVEDGKAGSYSLATSLCPFENLPARVSTSTLEVQFFDQAYNPPSQTHTHTTTHFTLPPFPPHVPLNSLHLFTHLLMSANSRSRTTLRALHKRVAAATRPRTRAATGRQTARRLQLQRMGACPRPSHPSPLRPHWVPHPPPLFPSRRLGAGRGRWETWAAKE